MQNWREQKRQARRVVHETMLVEALYYITPGAEPSPVHVRIHTKFDAIGDDRSMGWAEIQSTKPRLIFMRSERTPDRGCVVYVQPGEAYQIDNVLPPDDITITAEVTSMTKRQLEKAGLPTGETP